MTKLKPIPIETNQTSTRKKIKLLLNNEDKAIKSLGQKLMSGAGNIKNLSGKKAEELIIELQKTIIYIKKKRSKKIRKKTKISL